MVGCAVFNKTVFTGQETQPTGYKTKENQTTQTT